MAAVEAIAQALFQHVDANAVEVFSIQHQTVLMLNNAQTHALANSVMPVRQQILSVVAMGHTAQNETVFLALVQRIQFTYPMLLSYSS